MTRSHWRRMIFLLAIFWLAIVLGLYYAGHKPFSVEIFEKVARHLGVFALNLAAMMVAGGLGARFRVGRVADKLTSLSMQAAAGVGGISLIMLIVGAAIGVNPLVSWGLLIFLGFTLRRDMLAWLKNWREVGSLWMRSGRLGKALGLGIGGLLALTLLVSLAPPIKFDSLVYHLAIPQAYIQSGKVRYLPELMFWGMPQIGEMIYTWLMSMGGAEAATVGGWFVGVVACIGILGSVAQIFGAAAGWVAIAALVSGYTFVDLLPSGYVDMFTIWFGAAALFSLCEWQQSGEHKALIWSGIFSGLALGSKYTAGALALSVLALIFVVDILHKSVRTRLGKDLVVFLLPVVLVFLPWMIKNQLAVGNPFYPFFFESGSMDQHRLSYYHLPAWGTWKRVALLPVAATILGFEGAPGFSASLGPLLLALSPFAYLRYSRRSIQQKGALLVAGIVSGAGTLTWLIASRLSGLLIQSRLYFVLFPAIALLAGAGFQALAAIHLPGLRLRRIVGAMAVLVLGFTVVEVFQVTVQRDPLGVLVGIKEPEQYLGNNLGWYYPAMQAIQALPEQASVLMLWEPRSYYCQPKCTPDEILDRWRHAVAHFKQPEIILQEWEREYTHLLYNRFGAEFIRQEDPSYSTSDWLALNDLLERLPPPVEFGDAYLLYTLQP